MQTPCYACYLVLYMQSTLIIWCFVYKVSLLFNITGISVPPAPHQVTAWTAAVLSLHLRCHGTHDGTQRRAYPDSGALVLRNPVCPLPLPLLYSCSGIPKIRAHGLNTCIVGIIGEPACIIASERPPVYNILGLHVRGWGQLRPSQLDILVFKTAQVRKLKTLVVAGKSRRNGMAPAHATAI